MKISEGRPLEWCENEKTGVQFEVAGGVLFLPNKCFILHYLWKHCGAPAHSHPQ